MRAQAEFDQLVLKVRGREIKARLVDTSLTGLGIICDPSIQLVEGEQVQVSTEDGWFSAKVARVGITPQGRLVGLARHVETPATAQARKDESRLVAVVFATIVVTMPLLSFAWSRLLPRGRDAARSSPPAQLATAEPDQATDAPPPGQPEQP